MDDPIGRAGLPPLVELRAEGDGSFSVTIRGLGGLVGVGASSEEALAELEDALDIWTGAMNDRFRRGRYTERLIKLGRVLADSGHEWPVGSCPLCAGQEEMRRILAELDAYDREHTIDQGPTDQTVRLDRP